MVLTCCVSLVCCDVGASPTPGFGSPDAAARAFVTALRDDDVSALRALLGDAAGTVLPLGASTGESARRAALARESAQRTLLELYAQHRVVLRLGELGWAFPVSIVERDGTWRFATIEDGLESSSRRPS